MCGIVGVIRRGGAVHASLVSRMRDTMKHRGPDDAGCWTSPGSDVALAQTRLAIIDLSPGGHQPMTDPATGVTVTFNGEIYNFLDLKARLERKGHSFRTSSDTEVLLAAYREWGDGFLSELNGMFAFGLYDPRNATILLARDRAGEKPLFYLETAEGLAFASELKALLADPSTPRNLDFGSFAFFLASGYVPGERCILAGFRKLAQGHALSYSVATGMSRVWAYWSLPRPETPTRDPRELEETLESLLLDSVRLRLIADVPVGILLSGGIDSSLVTAMAARVSAQPVRTFNISFPGYAAFDEAPYARLVAQHFGADHTELAAEAASVDLLPALARQYDEPIGDSSMLPTYLVSRLIRQHATVALGGDGGDELFGGYFHYDWLTKNERLRRFVPAPVRRLAAAGGSLLPLGVRGRNYALGFSRDVPWTIAHIGLFFDRRNRVRLLASPFRERLAAIGALPEEWRVGLCDPSQSPLQQATSVDFRSYMVDDILVKVDRASMLASLEIRAPFLDPRLIEFAFGRVPDDLRSAHGERKILLRRLAARLLPPQMDLTRKQGFGVPLAAWFRGDFGALVEDVLGSADTALFDRSALRRLIRLQKTGLVNSHRLFALTMFELWRREYKIAV